MQERFKQAEEMLYPKDKKGHDLFNKWTYKMLNYTPKSIITEMAVRVFVGSRDIPRDVPKAMELLKYAQKKRKENQTTKEKYDIEFFEIMLKRLNSDNRNDPNNFWEINQQLHELAKTGQPNAMYTYGSELLQLCTNNVFQDRKLINEYLATAHMYLTKAAQK